MCDPWGAARSTGVGVRGPGGGGARCPRPAGGPPARRVDGPHPPGTGAAAGIHGCPTRAGRSIGRRARTAAVPTAAVATARRVRGNPPPGRRVKSPPSPRVRARDGTLPAPTAGRDAHHPARARGAPGSARRRRTRPGPGRPAPPVRGSPTYVTRSRTPPGPGPDPCRIERADIGRAGATVCGCPGQWPLVRPGQRLVRDAVRARRGATRRPSRPGGPVRPVTARCPVAANPPTPSRSRPFRFGPVGPAGTRETRPRTIGAPEPADPPGPVPFPLGPIRPGPARPARPGGGPENALRPVRLAAGHRPPETGSEPPDPTGPEPAKPK